MADLVHGEEEGGKEWSEEESDDEGGEEEEGGEEDREVIDYKEKLKIGEYHLSIHLWIENTDKRYLIQKRAKTMRVFPDMWSIVTGGVKAGESGMDAVIREAK